LFCRCIEYKGLARSCECFADAAGLRGTRFDLQAFAMLVFVNVIHQAGFGIEPANADIAGLEYLAQFVADQIHNRLKIEFGGETLLDGVDDLQFSFVLGEALFEASEF
jgi:hypothetical protein